MPPRKPKASAAGTPAPKRCRVKKPKAAPACTQSLDEFLTERANNPHVPEEMRRYCRNMLAGDYVNSDMVAAIIARRDARLLAEQERIKATT